ncbi:hypothetical protein L484_012614 [Morus notabilis]|uniref:Uncharacterized protein n=1 Tax=Morus notabilis TaxID=981085 RepID=W9SJZ8_9ROSA|nr:hypothetical protein L484_012614 [Morus notabilis]
MSGSPGRWVVRGHYVAGGELAMRSLCLWNRGPPAWSLHFWSQTNCGVALSLVATPMAVMILRPLSHVARDTVSGG